MFPTRFAVILFFITLCTALSSAQSGTSTRGTDFWMGFMKNNDNSPSESLSIFITSGEAASGTIDIPGQAWSQNFVVASNTTTTITIPNAIAEVLSNQVIESRAIHITTDQPVSVYAINFESNTADATKILPTPALGTTYIAAAYGGTAGHESELLVVATEDNTQIAITPSVSTVGGNSAGVSFTVSLQSGDCYQVKASGNGDLTGTSVMSTTSSGSCRPFAVFSGAGCGSVPSDCFACDHLFEQNYPLKLWGKDYFITPWVFDLSPDWPVAEPNYSYRILALSNNTAINIDGVSAINLNTGEFQEYNHQIAPHCIHADKPVAVIQYMEGIECGGNGDPSMVILDDITKKMDEVTFATVESSVITAHYLNLVINTNDLGGVMLDGSPINASLFQSFPFCNNQLWCGIEISEGSHTLSCSGGGVTAYVYGNGPNESYAFSVGSHYEIPPIEYEDVLCSLNTVLLELGPEYDNPNWYNTSDTTLLLSTNFQYQISAPIENGVYVVKCQELVSGCDQEFYYSVETPDPIPLVMEPSAITVCEHQPIQLHALASPASAIYQYSWSEGESLDNPLSASPIATPDHTTTYSVLVTTPGGCASASGEVVITVNDGNIAHFEASPQEVSICLNESTPLSVEVETEIWSDDFEPSISWGDWEDIVNGDASPVCGAESGNGLYFNGPFPREAITTPMDMSSGGTIYFSLKIANESAPCDDAEPGDNVVLAYSVSNGPWVNIQTFYESAYPDFVQLQVVVPGAAWNSDTRFRWRQGGSYFNNQDNWVLDNMYVGMESTNDLAFSWTPSVFLDDATSASPTATPTSNTTFLVSLTDIQTGCSYSDSVVVHVGGDFTIDMSGDVAICDVQGVELSAMPSAVGDYDYLWSPETNITGMYGSTPVVNPNTTTTYHVVVTSMEGCVAEGDVEVAVSVLLDLELTASDFMICIGEQTQLSAILEGNPPGVTYEWSPAINLSAASLATTGAAPLDDIAYTCTVTHVASGCILSEEIEIDVTQSFGVYITPDDVNTCVISGTTVEAGTDFVGDLLWQWSPATMVNNPTSGSTTLSGIVTGELTLTSTSEAGCVATATISVVEHEENTNLGMDTGICEDEELVLITAWPDTYTILWSTLETTSSIIVNQSGTYTVDVTSPEGCHSSDEITVTSYSYPVVLLGNDTSVCEGQVIELNAGPASLNYNWNNGLHANVISIESGGHYEVTVDNGYCFTTDEIEIVYNPLPVSPFDDEIIHCFVFDPVLELNAQNNGSYYLWNNDSIGKILPATIPGDYSVIIITAENCSAVFDVTVKGNCPESLYVPNSFTPDGDGVNDVWLVSGQNILNFHLRLYNRWGELFYESTDINMPWLGQRKDGNYYVEPGVYPYLITYSVLDENGTVSEERKTKGEVSLLR